MTGGTVGAVRWVLRLEGLLVLGLALLCYQMQKFDWYVFAGCFLIPDLSLLAYLINARVGALIYNMAHSYIGAVMSTMIFLHIHDSMWLMISLIWFAHIGFDRALGYGLKYKQGFRYTHLGLIGRQGHSP